MEPGVKERMVKSYPEVIGKMRELGDLHEKRRSNETGRTSYNGEELEALEAHIQRAEKEYMKLAFPEFKSYRTDNN